MRRPDLAVHTTGQPETHPLVIRALPGAGGRRAGQVPGESDDDQRLHIAVDEVARDDIEPGETVFDNRPDSFSEPDIQLMIRWLGISESAGANVAADPRDRLKSAIAIRTRPMNRPMEPETSSTSPISAATAGPIIERTGNLGVGVK
jgi:hypothetical protein